MFDRVRSPVVSLAGVAGSPVPGDLDGDVDATRRSGGETTPATRTPVAETPLAGIDRDEVRS